MLLLASLASTRTRLLVGSNAMMPVPCTNTANVGVALKLIATVTLLPGGCRHTPVTGSVWQMDRFAGSPAAPVLADPLMFTLIPTFTVATTKKPVPLGPGTLTMPGSGGGVADSITMSGTGDADARNWSVLTPVVFVAGPALEQPNRSWTSVDGIGAV